MISIRKKRLSTQSGFALSTTTILFYKKKTIRQQKCLAKQKNVVAG
jgi:hypothetical protein